MSSLAGQPLGSADPQGALAIIPARLGSTRLSRKMLLRETGRYLFEHTARNLIDGGAVQRVVVATDSEEILGAAREVGLEALMTRDDHASGTDRVHEAWSLLREGGSRAGVVVNVQGDEPDLDAEDLRALVAAFEEPEVELATLWTELEAEEAADPSAVKVVLDARGDALYFTRAAVPDARHARAGAPAPAYKRHVGVYAFRPAALERFCALPPGELEQLESLEQLRWLEAGHKLRVLRARHRPRGIDTAEDYLAFKNRIATP